MTQDEEDRPEAKVLKRLATALVAMDWIKPAIDPKLGAMAFREIVPILRSVPEIMSLLVRIDSSFIPTDTIRKISGSLENLGNLRIQIEGFSITADNARALRDQLSDKIRGSYKNFLLGVAPVLSLGLVKDIDVARIKIDLQKELEDVAGKRTEESAFELRMIQNMKTEAEETLRSIQAAAAQTGVSRHAKLFSTEAAEHRRAALLWAIFTVAMARELKVAKDVHRNAVRALEDARAVAGQGFERAFILLAEAEDAGLLEPSTVRPLPEEVVIRLRSATTWRMNPLPAAPNTRATELWDEISELRARAAQLSDEIKAAKRLAGEVGGFGHEIAEHRARLEPLGLVPHDSADGTQCPLCLSQLAEPVPTVVEMRRSWSG